MTNRLVSVTLGVELLVSGEGSRHGVPIPMHFIFGAVGLSVSISKE